MHKHPFSDKWIMDANIAAISRYLRGEETSWNQRGEKMAIYEEL